MYLYQIVPILFTIFTTFHPPSCFIAYLSPVSPHMTKRQCPMKLYSIISKKFMYFDSSTQLFELLFINLWDDCYFKLCYLVSNTFACLKWQSSHRLINNKLNSCVLECWPISCYKVSLVTTFWSCEGIQGKVGSKAGKKMG